MTKKPDRKHKSYLTAKQLAVIDDLFEGRLSEQEVLNRHHVRDNVYCKWLEDEQFNRQFNLRITRALRQSQLIIARYASLAAAKLVELTASDSQETARKACLDIISMDSVNNKYLAPSFTEGSQEEKSNEISAEAAGRILAALADEQKDDSL